MLPENLRHFTEWGGGGWVRLTDLALDQFLGRKLEGLRVLEIGSRSGGMSCLFGLLGADVLGVDVNPRWMPLARNQARRWNVHERVSFLCYNGNLDVLPERAFDVVFTKSVLVGIPGLSPFLEKLARRLTTDGKFVFLENGLGSPFLQLVRHLRHGTAYHRRARYFSNREIDLVRRYFDIEIIRKTLFPPIYLICGRKSSVAPTRLDEALTSARSARAAY